jgi:ABC-type multidrug transport system fused ATPase/permease subunit
MFALVIERDPLRYQDVPSMFFSWVQDAGGFAAFAVAIWIGLLFLGIIPFDWKKAPRGQSLAFRLFVLVGGICYLALFISNIPQWIETFSQAGTATATPTRRMETIQFLLLTVGGAFSIGAAGLAFVINITRMRGRRIGAITRLSFKEALRRRVPYAFAIILAIFLFGNWYVPYKPEDQVRTYVGLVYYAMGPLLLISALVLGSFSIPTDIRQQTIHTVLTKPVERFEIVLGRFLGFIGLLTLILLVMTTLSLIYVLRNVDPAAAAESLMARVPAYGELVFEGTGEKNKGESVGREWDYRSYIGGPNPGRPVQSATWNYAALSADVAKRPFVRCEFTFDVFRLDKGFENKNPTCSFVFQTWRFRRGSEEEYKRRRGEEERNRNLENESKPRSERKSATEIEAEVADQLGEEFGYYEKVGKPIIDYHTETIDIPGGFFRNALKGALPQESGSQPRDPASAIKVTVRNESTSGQIGMARYDLYFRLDNPEGGWETFWFAWNFYKGAIGLWFSTALVCGLAIALSTYLSGLISLLITAMFFIGGMFQEFIQSVGEGKNWGGGPLEALIRITTRSNISAPLEDSAAASAAKLSDSVFRWVIRRVLDVLPDVDRYSLSAYVAEGFDIPASQLWLSMLLLVGYLLPCALLAYYLIRWREIASQT